MAEPRRDEFPNNFVGNLVWTERGWTVVPPTCCPAGHDYARPGQVGQLGAAATADTWRGAAGSERKYAVPLAFQSISVQWSMSGRGGRGRAGRSEFVGYALRPSNTRRMAA
jgi:hypothetical protein